MLQDEGPHGPTLQQRDAERLRGRCLVGVTGVAHIPPLVLYGDLLLPCPSDRLATLGWQ
jgi:hypothetical protein